MGNSSSVAPRPPGSNVTNSSQLEVQEVPAPPEQHSREPGSGGAPTQESRREYFERNAAKFRERRIRMREEAAKRARDQHTAPDVPLEHTPTAPSAKAEMSVAPSGEQSPGTDSDVL